MAALRRTPLRSPSVSEKCGGASQAQVGNGKCYKERMSKLDELESNGRY